MVPVKKKSLSLRLRHILEVLLNPQLPLGAQANNVAGVGWNFRLKQDDIHDASAVDLNMAAPLLTTICAI